MIHNIRNLLPTLLLVFFFGSVTGTTIAAEDSDRKRVVASDQGDKTKKTLRLSQDIKMKVKMGKKKPVSACKARQNLSYYSGYEIVEVESEIKMTGCGSAHGTYAIRVTHKLDGGERNNTIFEETWAVSDTDTLVTTKTYDLGLDQYISKVRPREISCECLETVVAE